MLVHLSLEEVRWSHYLKQQVHLGLHPSAPGNAARPAGTQEDQWAQQPVPVPATTALPGFSQPMFNSLRALPTKSIVFPQLSPEGEIMSIKVQIGSWHLSLEETRLVDYRRARAPHGAGPNAVTTVPGVSAAPVPAPATTALPGLNQPVFNPPPAAPTNSNVFLQLPPPEIIMDITAQPGLSDLSSEEIRLLDYVRFQAPCTQYIEAQSRPVPDKPSFHLQSFAVPTTTVAPQPYFSAPEFRCPA